MAETICDSIYPLTIVADRYRGTYSGGKFTAWNLYPWGLPEEIAGDDIACMNFWYGEHGDKIVCGVGNTPDGAVEKLYMQLRRADNAQT